MVHIRQRFKHATRQSFRSIRPRGALLTHISSPRICIHRVLALLLMTLLARVASGITGRQKRTKQKNSRVDARLCEVSDAITSSSFCFLILLVRDAHFTKLAMSIAAQVRRVGWLRLATLREDPMQSTTSGYLRQPLLRKTQKHSVRYILWTSACQVAFPP